MQDIDILMATYNGEKYVAEQIDSILNQSYNSFRLIISDDCSTDNTFEILKKYAKKDNRIVLYKQELNLGVNRNFQFLLDEVTAEYFMFSDQDDIWKEDKIEKSINKLKETDSDLVYTDLEVIDENYSTIYKSYWRYKGFWHKIKKYNNYESLFLNNYITGCTMLVKSKFIKQTQPAISPIIINSRLLHDHWTALIVSIQGKMSYIDEPLVQYRQHGDNQIGARMLSGSMKSFDDIRTMFINNKQKYLPLLEKESKRLKQNRLFRWISPAKYYYDHLKDKKFFHFGGWGIFHRLYKYENFEYRFLNFIILNMPFIGRIAFNIRKFILSKLRMENNLENE